MKSPLFYAKILLFGEYGIIENSKGLTIPFNDYKGVLKFDKNEFSSESNLHLKKFATYLHENFPKDFRTQQFMSDVEAGMYFHSDIPQGYGVGSSGALVAAIYDQYAIEKIDVEQEITKEKIAQLKKLFSQMESFFHGTSSGIDPLICYMKIPLLIQSKDDISTVGLPAEKEGTGAIFLINSGAPGETAPMVQLFFEKLKNEGFRKTLREEFINYNNACIDDFVKGEFKPLFANLKKLSSWAFEHFRPMIPAKLVDAWKKGIDTNSYYLKLCGSGGGGYVLGFTEDYAIVEEQLKHLNPEVVYRF
ncbi:MULTISPECIES: mevalonate kinase [Weeksella]|uniref:mevalonate kinase family protein n=1 Tax=Weeksella TaxID=1013 RepID=UPI0008A53C5A|nr:MULTISPECIES: mevalonate kinase [Weeksella]MDK7374111.1 mevalonate kinase [Weeksella virosa]OFM82791.1 mevalonate kinase [Weeksella sp. HMSC059D05]